MSQTNQSIYRFDRFTLDAGRHLLTDENGAAIDLTPKAVEILCLLVENAGQLVTKEELMKSVWADSFVEEANLSHHIFKLRKALGGDDRKLIETVPKRGYRFIGELKAETSTTELQSVPDADQRLPWRVIIPAAAVLLILTTTGWFLYSRLMPEPADTVAVQDIRSIAVMPFVNESGNDDVEYLSDGMTETLINSLSEVPSLRVKSRPAVFKYKGREVATTSLASELGVQALLFGRLTLRGSDLTLFLSLIDPNTENQIWGKQYVRKLSDLVALQNEIGRDVAHSLEARLTSATEDRLSKNYSKKGEAYRLYLLGDYHWAKFTEENFLRAKKYYEDAIAIDPNYALAYTGLSNTYSVLGVNGHMHSFEARPLSRAAAERAIEINPNLPEAHVSMGAYRMFFEWDLDGAERHFRRAMELNADYAVPHELLAYSLRARGRHAEAIAAATRATELDPLHLLMLGDVAVCYRFAGNVEKSIEIDKRLLEMDPNFGDAYFEYALAHSQLGQHDVALELAIKALSLTGNSTKVKAGLGMVYGRAGRTANAQGVIDELLAESKERYVSPMDIALVYSTIGDRDRAIEWLEKAYAERTPWMFEINVTPELDPIRDDPRFQDLVRRVGITNN